MKVWILQTGEQIQIDEGNLRGMRAVNLSNDLIERGHEVTLWTSDFDHFSKKHRFAKENEVAFGELLTIRLIPSCGYSSNFGLKRLIDHAQLGWNLKIMLKGVPAPDIAFVGYPPIEPAWVMTRFLGRLKIPVVLDVKDAWPEILVRGFPKRLQFFAKILLSPYFFLMKDTFQKSSFLSSITPDFLKWAQGKARRSPREFDDVNYLSTLYPSHLEEEIEEGREFWDSLKIFGDNTFRVSYIGSLTKSLNMDRVIEAAKNSDMQFVIAGDGNAAPLFKEMASDLPNVVFPGWISAAQAFTLVERSEVLLAPYADLEDFAISLPNKFLDALAHGKPIVSSLRGYSENFIEQKNVGRFYSNDVAYSLLDLLLYLQETPEEIELMSQNAKLLFESDLSGEIVYRDLVRNLEIIFKQSCQGNP